MGVTFDNLKIFKNHFLNLSTYSWNLCTFRWILTSWFPPISCYFEISSVFLYCEAKSHTIENTFSIWITQKEKLHIYLSAKFIRVCNLFHLYIDVVVWITFYYLPRDMHCSAFLCVLNPWTMKLLQFCFEIRFVSYIWSKFWLNVRQSWFYNIWINRYIIGIYL